MIYHEPHSIECSVNEDGVVTSQELAQLVNPSYNSNQSQEPSNQSEANAEQKVINVSNNVTSYTESAWTRMMFMLKILVIIIIILAVAGVGGAKHKEKHDKEDLTDKHSNSKLKITFVVLGLVYLVSKIFNGKKKS